MQNLSGVAWNRCPSACAVFVYLVTATLSRKGKSGPFQRPDCLRRRDPWSLFTHAATSTIVRLTDSACGTASPFSTRSSM